MKNTQLDSAPFAQRQRLQFIESVAYWEGLVGRPSVSELFGVSENHITRDFALYRKLFPGNLDYDVSARAYRPSKGFKPKISAGSAEEYLALLRAYFDTRSVSVLPVLGNGVGAACLPPPIAPLDKDVLREITRALRQNRGAAISYQSLTSPNPATREIWPHALVFAGVRWHVRGYDTKRKKFIDVVLHRIISAKPIDRPCPVPVDEDWDWHAEVEIDIRPSKSLSSSQKKVIAKEYGMVEIDGSWTWRVTLRRCLVAYFLKWLRLDLPEDESYPVVLADPDLKHLYGFSKASDSAY